MCRSAGDIFNSGIVDQHRWLGSREHAKTVMVRGRMGVLKVITWPELYAGKVFSYFVGSENNSYMSSLTISIIVWCFQIRCQIDLDHAID